MAEKEQLRRAMLTHLMGNIGVDPSVERTVDALLPLIEHWTRSIILVSEQDFEVISRELEREDDGTDAAAFRRMAALSKVRTVSEVD